MITSEVPLDQYGMGRIHASDSDVRTAIDSIAEIRAQGQDVHVNRIAVTWPSGDGGVGGHWALPTLLDAETQDPIPNVVGYAMHDNANDPLGAIADIEVYADSDGNPLPAGAPPQFTDDYRSWIERGMPEGGEPAPQVCTAVVRYIIASMSAPPVPVRPADRKQVRVAVGDWWEWVSEDRADAIRALRQAGFATLSEHWSRPDDPTTFVAIREPGDESGIETARRILAECGIAVEREYEFNGHRHFAWTLPADPAQPKSALADNTRALLAEFMRYVQDGGQYPAAETYDTRLAVQCLEHAMRCVDEVAVEPDGCTS